MKNFSALNELNEAQLDGVTGGEKTFWENVRDFVQIVDDGKGNVAIVIGWNNTVNGGPKDGGNGRAGGNKQDGASGAGASRGASGNSGAGGAGGGKK
jgi:hypothetical protein